MAANLQELLDCEGDDFQETFDLNFAVIHCVAMLLELCLVAFKQCAVVQRTLSLPRPLPLSATPSLQVLRSNFGAVETVELVPGGSKIPVTKDTRRDYVNAYVKYVMTVAVKEPFEAFAGGFLRVCGGKLLVGGNSKQTSINSSIIIYSSSW